MTRILPTLAAAFLLALPAAAQLSEGADAPDFTVPATQGDKEFTFSLKEALAKGPVVLYFYPAAFTKGCTIEAHDFAEATEKFASLGATVIGVSADGIDKLKEFSTAECKSKFPVASDADQTVMKAYDAVLEQKPELSNRTSYVISPEGKILFAYTALDPEGHVEKTMSAVETWKLSH